MKETPFQEHSISDDETLFLSLIDVRELLHVVVTHGDPIHKFDQITVNQGRIFSYIFRPHDGPIQLKMLAHDLNVTPAAASQAIDRLVVAGLVVRRQAPTDRRAVIIDLSSKGRKLYREIAARNVEVIRDCLGGIPEETRTAFTKTLRHLADALHDRWEAILAENDARLEAARAEKAARKKRENP